LALNAGVTADGAVQLAAQRWRLERQALIRHDGRVARDTDQWNTPGDRSISQDIHRDVIDAVQRTEHIRFWIYLPVVVMALGILSVVGWALDWF
jgi:hypothetical protein